MSKLPADGFPPETFASQSPTFMGLDIAVNREKGLRCSLRTNGRLWETTLRFRNAITLQRHYPFVGIPVPTNGITPDFLTETFLITTEQARSLSLAINQAACVAIDGPQTPAIGNRRSSESIWHNHIIPGVKDHVGGIYWTPSGAELNNILDSLFCAQQILTTEQITKLGQSLWMFVGFWTHVLFRSAGQSTIEVFPAALRAVCQEIAASEHRQELEEDYRNWGATKSLQNFITTKNESNDAAIACFAAYLRSVGKTEELHQNEIVVPLHRGRPFNPQVNT